MKIWEWIRHKLGIYTSEENYNRGVDFANEFFARNPCNDEIYYEYESLYVSTFNRNHPFDRGVKDIFNQRMREIERLNPKAFQEWS